MNFNVALSCDEQNDRIEDHQWNSRSYHDVFINVGYYRSTLFSCVREQELWYLESDMRKRDCKHTPHNKNVEVV